ncbi:MAG: histidinol-phosphate transaminase [Magnetococcales bacterium]|nr:histidinol-phosphate transaminase [Magnetococcales bacterium]
MEIHRWVRREILEMAGYQPGEQPADGRPLIKLNTNENPSGPPAAVIEAITAATGAALRLYPEPSSRPVREAAARAYGVEPDQVVVGNGSDDLLTMTLRLFVGPGEVVAAPDPTYTLYAPLTSLQGGSYRAVPWGERLATPVDALAATGAKLIFLTRPNAPTGHAVPLAEVAALCRAAPGVVLLDEAYVDFCHDHGLGLLADHPNLIITRSFSKSLALAGLRVGLAFMAPELAREYHKVRDSYNVNRLSQAGAVAALDNLPAFAPTIARIRTERDRLTQALRNRGFTITPSQANFLLAAIPPASGTGADWVRDLRQAGILVRHFGADPALADALRITIGTPEEMQALVTAVDAILANKSRLS